MSELELLRAFMPETVVFGSDREHRNGQWQVQNGTHSTWFFCSDIRVQVLIFPNPDLGCMELQFRTVLVSKPDWPACLWPDPDLPPDPNRATRVFRQVVHVMLTRLQHFDRIGFSGAQPALDQIYGRLARLGYVQKLLVLHGFRIEQSGCDVFLQRLTTASANEDLRDRFQPDSQDRLPR